MICKEVKNIPFSTFSKAFGGMTIELFNLYYKNSGVFISTNKDFNEISYVATCRESFMCIDIRKAFNSPQAEYIAFFCPDINIEKVDEFFVTIKKKIKLKEKVKFHRASFDGTLNNSLIYIQVPPFWRVNGFRRALFTLFLRCAALFYKEGVTFERALQSYNLAVSCLPMLNYFFEGNTVINSKLNLSTNTVNHFANNANKSLDYIKTNLTKEPNP